MAASGVTRAFGALVLAQAAHSAEEYVGRLWESFPPARLVTGMISADRERGFLVLNALLLLFGLWCLLWPVRRGWRSAAFLTWAWVVVEAMNGAGHLLWSLRERGYTPGAGSAPLLLVAAAYLARQARGGPRSVGHTGRATGAK
ncbi:MAG TPA: HXXEE domain-containing protein [Gemmatimonadaceae bacterium]|nr:HXXEE domain-containing protein [Gemmatimonadaceae bacterium]